MSPSSSRVTERVQSYDSDEFSDDLDNDSLYFDNSTSRSLDAELGITEDYFAQPEVCRLSFNKFIRMCLAMYIKHCHYTHI